MTPRHQTPIQSNNEMKVLLKINMMERDDEECVIEDMNQPKHCDGRYLRIITKNNVLKT